MLTNTMRNIFTNARRVVANFLVNMQNIEISNGCANQEEENDSDYEYEDAQLKALEKSMIGSYQTLFRFFKFLQSITATTYNGAHDDEHSFQRPTNSHQFRFPDSSKGIPCTYNLRLRTPLVV